jgi:HAE1 family hydrophobic/amphiphilic exporter-1
MMIFIVLIMGFVSFTKIPLDLMPEMEIPVAVISTTYQGVGPQEIEKLITMPLEEAAGSAENIKSMNSISSEGSSLIITQFDFGTDMESASLELREKIDQIKGYLPQEAGDPMVFKFYPTAMPIMMLSLSSDKLSLSDLQTLAEDTIKPRLERAEGVVSAQIVGGVQDVVEIKASSEKLQGYGVSMDYVANILKSENLSLPGRNVNKGDQELTVNTSGEFESVEEIQQLIIPLPSGTTVQLHDLAEVRLKNNEPATIAKANGRNSIDLIISKQSGANSVKVSEAAHKEIEKLNQEIEGTRIVTVYDTADYIKSALNSVFNSAVIGGILAILILYLFLRNLRTTFIIAVAIPISVIATFCLIYFSGITLNMMTLGGLALGIGMLVDNSIVVLDNIYRFRQDGYSRIESAVKGSSEVSMALIASTATTLAVFLPIVFVQGLTSTLFKQLALTVSFSLASSLVVALTLVPMLCSKFLRVDRNKPLTFAEKAMELFDKAFQAVVAAYSGALAWTLKNRKKVVAIATLAFVLSMASIALIGAEFFPESDEGFVQIGIRLPDGAELDHTVALMDEIEAKMKGVPEIDTVFLEAGYTGDMMGTANSNRGTMYVKLTPLSERKRGVTEIADDIRSRVIDTPGAQISVAPMESMSMGSGGSPINISIYGDELDTLKMIGDDFVKILEGIQGPGR